MSCRVSSVTMSGKEIGISVLHQHVLFGFRLQFLNVVQKLVDFVKLHDTGSTRHFRRMGRCTLKCADGFGKCFWAMVSFLGALDLHRLAIHISLIQASWVSSAQTSYCDYVKFAIWIALKAEQMRHKYVSTSPLFQDSRASICLPRSMFFHARVS